MMASGTTILGYDSAYLQSLLRSPMAVAIMGGLLVGTVITLMINQYSMLYSLK